MGLLWIFEWSDNNLTCCDFACNRPDLSWTSCQLICIFFPSFRLLKVKLRMLDRDLKSLPAGSTALFRDDNLQVVKTAKGSLQIFNQASWSFAEIDFHKASCRLDVPKIRLQGYEVSLYRLVPDLEAFSAKLTKLILFYLFFCPRSTPVYDLWFGLTKLNRIARWVQCASYVVWCATSDQSHATWCLRRFIRRSLQMEKKQVRLFFCWTATLIRCYF